MAASIFRIGSKRARSEGLRLGAVRRLPRGVRKTEYASRDLLDQWFPELAPSARLLDFFHRQDPMTDRRWAQYTRRFRSEMRKPSPQRILAALAALSHQADFSLGCYCEDENYCHRSLLRDMLAEKGARIRR